MVADCVGPTASSSPASATRPATTVSVRERSLAMVNSAISGPTMVSE